MNKQPDIALIRKYLNGELDARAMYELERQAEHDPLLRDLLAGMEMASPEEHTANLTDIRQRLQARLAAGKTPVRRMYFGRWAVAASVLVMLSMATLFLLRREPTPAERMAAAPTGSADATDSLSAAPEPAESEKPLLAQILPEEVAEKAEAATVARKKAVARPYVVAEAVAEHQATPDPLPQTQNEVVVVGFGTQKKESMVGSAVTAVAPQDTLSANANDALAGRVSGVIIRGRSSRKSDSDQSQVLEEMVASKKRTLKKAEPVTGWKAYRNYLRDAAVTNDQKRATVTVAFRVDTTGTPLHIRIVKSNGSEAVNRQAIQLIRNGARWFAAADSAGNEVQVKIKFR